MRDFSQAAKWADFPGEETAISADGNELNESLPGDSDPALPEWQITEGGHLPAHMGIGIDPQRPGHSVMSISPPQSRIPALSRVCCCPFAPDDPLPQVAESLGSQGVELLLRRDSRRGAIAQHLSCGEESLRNRHDPDCLD